MAFGKLAAAKAAPARTAAPARAPAKRTSMWAKYTPQEQRLPLLEADGSYLCRIGTVEKKIKPACAPNAGRESFHAQITVEDAAEGSTTKAGETVNFMCLLSTPAGQDEAFRFTMAASGHADVPSYNAELNPNEDGAFMAAVLGEETNEYNEGGNPLEGRLVQIDVRRGKDTGAGDGDYYRVYRCSSVEQ
jgi:hypothetical protein